MTLDERVKQAVEGLRAPDRWPYEELDHRAADLITDLHAALKEAERERDEARGANEHDRTAVIDARNAIKDAITRRSWMLTSRGSYEWDDDRYRQEFGDAIEEIGKPLEILAKIGADWSHCPTDPVLIASARTDWKVRANALAADLERAREVMKPFANELVEDDGSERADLRHRDDNEIFSGTDGITIGDLRRLRAFLASGEKSDG